MLWKLSFVSFVLRHFTEMLMELQIRFNVPWMIDDRKLQNSNDNEIDTQELALVF